MRVILSSSFGQKREIPRLILTLHRQVCSVRFAKILYSR